MSATDTHTVDPAMPHPSANMGHEMSDFSWTSVLWLLPISVIALVAFALVCLYWFRGAKDTVVLQQATMVNTEELDLHRAKSAEFLNQYKWLDKEKGKVRIPIQRAMDLVVEESKGSGKLDWAPITDTYIRANAFSHAAAKEIEPQPATGVAEEDKAPQGKAAEPAPKAHEKKAEAAAEPAKKAAEPAKAPEPAKAH